ncbi:MAG TPA: dTDP-4-dehydrorhamnose 3,5-epimerase, partial [Clostridiaceae bacterium]|nr:dTDP-4-dehydrorhamnose 3,5-epimerase [Clostridiaceae bacterium]
PEDEGGIIWNDPDIGIKWPLENKNNIILSNKDKLYQTIRYLK